MSEMYKYFLFVNFEFKNDNFWSKLTLAKTFCEKFQMKIWKNCLFFVSKWRYSAGNWPETDIFNSLFWVKNDNLWSWTDPSENFMFQTNISKIVHFRCKNHHLWPKIDHGEYTTKRVFVFFDSKKPIIWMQSGFWLLKWLNSVFSSLEMTER